ncbi:hypothetical protein AFERRI_180005 [Acidithiobacillus ferrivorans]|uniref:Uncharacterized protein n=2 Tax=Acidithiobacillus ferrivorans TaxID=160808 RepID=A0A060URD7_9PROT|nr:hypothetical protein AFERRI_180005 [Acidithiobacillus ferrivorans]
MQTLGCQQGPWYRFRNGWLGRLNCTMISSLRDANMKHSMTTVRQSGEPTSPGMISLKFCLIMARQAALSGSGE